MTEYDRIRPSGIQATDTKQVNDSTDSRNSSNAGETGLLRLQSGVKGSLHFLGKRAWPYRKLTNISVHSLRFVLPRWLAQKVWEIGLSRSMLGWQTVFRVYNIVPPESEICKLASIGDCTGIIKLFEAGLASPFDVDTDGRNALDVGLSNYCVWQLCLPTYSGQSWVPQISMP
jgi:hypothetical protein